MSIRYSGWNFNMSGEYGRPLWRGLAGLVDMVLIVGPIVWLAYRLDSADPPARPAREDTVMMAFLLFELCALIYTAWLHASPWQATVGKRLFRLKVTDRQGKRLTLARSLWRSLAWQMSWLSLGAGLALVLLSKKRQSVHDCLAGTLVVKAHGLL